MVDEAVEALVSRERCQAMTEQLRRAHRIPVKLTVAAGEPSPVVEMCLVDLDELSAYEDALYDACSLAASAGLLHELEEEPDARAELEAEANHLWNRLTLFSSELQCAGAAEHGLHHG